MTQLLFKRSDGKATCTIREMEDGHFRFFTEAWVVFTGPEEYDNYEYLAPEAESGIYASEAECLAAAEAEHPWIKGLPNI